MNDINTPDAKTNSPEPQETKNTDQSFKGKLATFAIVAVVLAAGIFGWITLRKENQHINSQAAYLTNDRDVMCARLTEKYMQCEDVETGELNKFVIPEELRDYHSIIQSPDRKRMLVVDREGGVFVTDGNFQNTKKLLNVDDPALIAQNSAWIGSNRFAYFVSQDYKYEPKNGVVSEAGRETTLVIVDAETGKQDNLYKVRGFGTNSKIIGGNSQYVFLAVGSPYNWAAKEAQASPGIMQAVRISDGYVRTINSHQIDYNEDYSQVVVDNNYNAVYAGESTNLFYFVGNSATDSSQYIRVGKLEEKNYGMQLTRVADIDTGKYNLLSQAPPLMTSRGSLTGNGLAFPHVLINDSEERTELKLSNGYEFFTFESMPQMEKAATNQPEIKDYLTLPGDTPAAVRSFLESLVTKDNQENQYNPVVLHGRVGESQLEVSWRPHGTSYFVLNDGKYEEVLTTAHGLSCEDRDAAGISPQLADCLRPGEGI